MECFFGSYKRGQEDGIDDRLVCFSIPDAGIVFKAPFTGDELHTEYASLLTLMEFIELNQKLFDGKELEIYSDNVRLVNQINKLEACQYEFSELLRKALEYKKKYKFNLGWIPRGANPSTGLLFD